MRHAATAPISLMTWSARSRSEGGDREAEGLGGFEVDDELELRRLLDRQVGWLRALEDLVYVDCGSPHQLDPVGAIGHETADRRELTKQKYCRKPILEGPGQRP